MPLYAPTVTIDGQTIDTGWDEETTVLTLAAPLSIEWGRSTWLADNSPSTLKVDVIDRDGSWATANQAIGKEIIVSGTGLARPVLFRGLVGSADVTIEYRRSPITGQRERYFRASLICDSHQATVAAAKGNRYAPATSDPNATYYADNQGNSRPVGLRRWLSANAGTRQQGIQDALTLMGLKTVTNYPLPYLSPDTPHRHAIIWDDQDVSVWDVFCSMVASWPLAVANYDDTNNYLTFQRPNFDPVIGLTYTTAAGVNISYTPYAGDFAWAASLPVQQIPAARVQYAGNAALRSGVGSAIDAAQVTLPWLVTRYNGGQSGTQTYNSLEQRFDVRAIPGRRADRPGAKTIDYTSDLLESDVPSGTAAATLHFMSNLAPRVATTIAGTNGRFSLPRFRFDFAANADAPKDLREALIYPRPVDKTFALVGAEFNALPNVAPAYHIIGGTLTWDGEGWVGEYDTAPTASPRTAVAAPLTIAALFGNSPATLAEINPTFNDLALPGIGL